MTVAKKTLPNQSIDTAPEYKDNIDASMKVLAEVGGNFAPHEALVPDMTVVIDSGKLFNGVTQLIRLQQTTSVIVAPVTDPRIDRVAVNLQTGLFVIIAGTEAASPVAPSYDSSHYPVCQIALAVGQTTIVNTDIIDERSISSGIAGIASTATSTQLTLSDTDAVFGASVRLNTNNYLYIGAGSTLRLKHDSAQGVIENLLGNLWVTNSADSALTIFYNYNSVGAGLPTIYTGGAIPVVKLFGNGIVALETTAAGNISILNNLFAQNNISLVDNKQIQLGSLSGGDAYLYHSGANFHLKGKTGGLFFDNEVNSALSTFRNYDTSGVNKTCLTTGGAVPVVKLYYDGAETLRTSPDGIRIGNLANWTIGLVSGHPLIGFDANDYMYYDRTNNKLIFNISASTRMVIRNNTVGLTLPTSSAGLVAGDLWNNAGVVNIV